MVKELSYATISCVLESWETARRTPNFEEVVGTMTLLKMFDYKPDTKAVFGFDVDYCPTPQELKDSGNLNIALSIIQKFDASLQMLGPDSELLEEILVDLGKRHARYGVKAHYFPFFGKALMHTMKETIGNQWTPDTVAAWNEVYQEISGTIMNSVLLSG